MQRWMTSQQVVLAILGMLAFASGQQVVNNRNTELVAEQDDAFLLLSTLGGSLVAVGQRSGKIRWQLDDEPIVKVPINLSETKMPMFLPGPRDGSLYLFGRDPEALKRLPYTIPQLVANSPCRSSDGILYTGRKVDTWFSIDPTTGKREQLLSFNDAKNTCPLDVQNTIFVGRTEYNIIMVDSKHKDRKWNVTFYDYSAEQMESDMIDNYDLAHFTASSTGRVVTLDRRGGRVLWDLNLKSPVIAMYIVTKDGLLTIPFKSIADSLLETFVTELTDEADLYSKWFPTLYIGQHRYGLYALPSYVESESTTISSSEEHLLLGGPSHVDVDDNNILLLENHGFVGTDVTEARDDCKVKNIIMLGHYKVPMEYKQYQPLHQPLQITGRSDPIILDTPTLNVTETTLVAMQADDIVSNDTVQSESKRSWQKFISKTYSASKIWIDQQENKDLKFTVIFICIVIVYYLFQASRKNSRVNSPRTYSPIAEPEDIDTDLVKVGKITFDAQEVLGKGCDGTFVYKGEFDGRDVAVKRLMKESFTLADREVALLRESDEHANVVRYFCTEQDRTFKYIALELAEATLQDYVTGKYDREKISVKDILHQATAGLAHLHSLDIVHRDIKPHNVLLSVPGPQRAVRAMISDFGLCKKLQLDRVSFSFSKGSGPIGTDGWIAPEIMNKERTTCAVDIFSLGCVFYYVLTNGKHPFGDSIWKQQNIQNNENVDLSALQELSPIDRELALLLVKAMISRIPEERPPASAISTYPIFWYPRKIMNFFQDVSDRVETDQYDSPAVIALETSGECVVQDDWKSCIDEEVATDMGKYRSYHGESVRDLLRALRNKKHHYRELSEEAQKKLGSVPDDFAKYWLTKFPCLLCHVWCAMQRFHDEPSLEKYYYPQYTFTSIYKGEEGTVRIERIMKDKSVSNKSAKRVKYYQNKKKKEKKQEEQEEKKVSPMWILAPK
ncbi:hypothetical protein DMN91_004412 [Ooceraea biroi]|uniref:non-specific serine/threonine protein kinase n=1 Tax=Ooceraea biroi TaxID=2015173 RepID=A0A026X0B3_OOCBI|nr:serine/threonine-protein kinase/endoribonuclease IRE1 [Ooceraea biroi]EZA61735.1 Serine/threonine-protein kinase/endoribonuclease IRE2 [Ooceraea biroi]RLU24202.1 hypothetical protein DMN91_004412 [Ooceraea biroi]